MAAPATSVTLNNGVEMPTVGLGCWMGKPVKDEEGNTATEAMVASGLKVGYRHIDTANGYGNQSAVGAAVRASGLARKDIWVTTKLNQPDHGRVAEAFQEALDDLDIEYIDLFLIHWPFAFDKETNEKLLFGTSPTVLETWQGMEKLVETGKVRAIGVSNFSRKILDELLPHVKIVPAVNQVESHPYMPNEGLAAYCKEKGIHMTAYSPLGMADSPIIKEPVITSIATKLGKEPGQVVLSFTAQRGWSVIPKSANPSRQATNLDIFTLAKDDFAAIEAIHKEPGKLKSLCQYGADFDEEAKMFGVWSFAEMGWTNGATQG